MCTLEMCNPVITQSAIWISSTQLGIAKKEQLWGMILFSILYNITLYSPSKISSTPQTVRSLVFSNIGESVLIRMAHQTHMKSLSIPNLSPSKCAGTAIHRTTQSIKYSNKFKLEIGTDFPRQI